ncbi:neutral zinc metallopeptidase [Thiorhodococcus fuscus]|uniref:Neutral zinc metallopeptidase n=1 Tax=Thiorhodococcus fuscus TaxID=527200 RepID=A0ABW4YC72_9GAMM
MRWEDGRRSDNIEDRRDEGFSGQPTGFGPRLGIRGGVGGILVVVVLLLLGVDPSQLLSQLDRLPIDTTPSSHQTTPHANGHPAGQDQLADFVSVVLADTEDTWTTVFREHGKGYSDPHLVLFSGATRSACGLGQAAMGPFYCPADRKVYIDLSFYDDLRERFGAPGDFAQAYVIAHEVGHHVQNLLGISTKVHNAQQKASRTQANALSVRLELQADCFAGLWAHRAHVSRDILEPGDLEEGLRAASAIGDDRLQRQSQGRVTPDSFTHGSSAQRVRWFKRGFQDGDIGACDTFSAKQL